MALQSEIQTPPRQPPPLPLRQETSKYALFLLLVSRGKPRRFAINCCFKTVLSPSSIHVRDKIYAEIKPGVLF